MNLEDRLRGELHWQAEQIDPYEARLAGIRDRGVQRRRRAQTAAAGALAAVALAAGGSFFTLQGMSEKSAETIYAEEPETESTAELSVVPPADIGDEDTVVAAGDGDDDNDDDGDVLPDLLSVADGAIFSRQSDGASTQLGAAAPSRGSTRVAVHDGVSGYVQFGDHDIYWTPGTVAPAERVIEISTSGAELGYSKQSLVPGDVYLSAAGNPVVVYAIERSRDGEIAQQLVIRRELLTGTTSTIWSAGDGADSDVGGSIRQLSVGGDSIAIVHDGAERCSVRLFAIATGAESMLDVGDCPGRSYGSLAPDGGSFAWVEAGVVGKRVGIVEAPSGEEMLATTIDESLPIGAAVASIDFDGRFVAIPRGEHVLVIDIEDESNHVLDGLAGPSTIASASSLIVRDSTLRVADAEWPTDEPCPRVSGALVTLLRPTDEEPGRPRCSRVDSGQRLAFENDGDDAWSVQFAHIDVEIEPGETHEDVAPLGAFLRPGVHALSPQPAAPDVDPVDDDAADDAASDETDWVDSRDLVGSLLWFDPSGSYEVALRGYGPMLLGDDFDTANRSIGGVLDPAAESDAVATGCATTTIGPASSRVALTIVRKADLDDTVVDTSTDGTTTAAMIEVTTPGITTLSGIGIGDTVREVVSAYRNRIEIEDSTTYDGGIDLIFTPESEEDAAYLLIFVTDGTQVLSYRTGLADLVIHPNGCDGYLGE